MRLRVPQENFARLEVPALAQWPALVQKNRELLSECNCSIAGIPLASLRQRARTELLEAARSYHSSWDEDPPPADLDSHLIVTGHQPELYHPGVWVKNFAAGSLAQKLVGRGVNVIVDNDTLKSTSIRVPAGTPAAPYFATVAFDQANSEIPFEERFIVDEEAFEHFADRVLEEMGQYSHRPLIGTFWKEVLSARKKSANIGQLFSVARRRIEHRWGLRNLEVPLSTLCSTRSFCLFAADLIWNAERFAKIYNSALLEYRRKNKIRSRNHPVPELEYDGQWLEVPFWAWSSDQPRRQHVFLWRNGGSLQLKTNASGLGELKATHVEELAEQLQAGLDGWKIRPRALMTTAYFRLLLADLFIHGVGGGKYDELTDGILQRYLGNRLPEYAVLSATLKLPQRGQLVDPEQVEKLQRVRRDLEWNPDRHLDEHVRELEPAQGWIERKYELMQETDGSRHERVHRFLEFRQLNDNLRRLLGSRPQEIDQQLAKARTDLRTQQALASREFAFVLHDEEKLRELMQAVRFA